MAWLRYLPIILTVVLLVAALVDVIRIDPSRVRALPKPLWAVIVIVIAIVGPILWFVLGRERLEPRNHGRYGASLAPDDDPAFLGRIQRDKEQEQRIRDLEERLAELDDDSQTPGDDAPRGDETPKP